MKFHSPKHVNMNVLQVRSASCGLDRTEVDARGTEVECRCVPENLQQGFRCGFHSSRQVRIRTRQAALVIEIRLSG